MDRGTSEDEMDVDTDVGEGGSRSGAFLRGVVLGAVISMAAAVAVSLTSPPPADLPLDGRVEIVGQPPATEGEAMAEAHSDAAAGEVPGETTPDRSEPAIVAVVPQGSGAAVPESAEDALPEIEAPETETTEPETPETATLDAAPAGGTPLKAGTANTPPGEDPRGEDDPSAAEPGETEPAADAPDPATAASPADSTELATVPETGPETVPNAPPDSPSGASAQSGPASSALAANARAFDAPRQAPLLAVVLTGDEVADLSAERLALLTMPLTVAVPPEAPGAAQLGADARAAGHEVLADLSPAARAAGSPAPVAAERIAALDMAVGATATSGAADADLLEPVLAELGRHGFAWVDTGAAISTPAERIAREIGMPYTQGNTTIAGDASPDQIYRAIDSAAHQARQWGTSVLFLDASEPALQALLRWGLEQPSDNAVWFSPISAVIERRAAR